MQDHGNLLKEKEKKQNSREYISIYKILRRAGRMIKDSLGKLLEVDESRKDGVRQDITNGSMPRTNYYILLSISVLIAGFGLVISSPAVVIGAMLISPLMTPIFGISLGLVQGNFKLLRRAALAEFGGVAIAIVMALLLGLLPFAQEVTPEMLTRTSPTLIDLLVATLAGMAGCFAMIDETMSPVLPGIAMATALIPPLATSGICIAFGAYEGAWGAFLLFFANFLAILAVSAALFIFAGFVTREEMGSGLDVIKRFSGPAVGLILVTVLLTGALIDIVSDRRINESIRSVLQNELATERGAFIKKIIFDQEENKTQILASVTTPNVISPKHIKQIQDKLDKSLQTETNLIIRCEITKDISSTGSASGVVGQGLDGDFVTKDINPKVRCLQLSEQVLREIFEDYPNLYLDNLDLVEMSNKPVLVATVQMSRTLLPEEVAEFEKAIRRRLGDENIRLLVRCDDLVDVTSKGRILYGRAHLGELSTQEKLIQEKIENTVRSKVMGINNMFAPNVDAQKGEGKWNVRAEVVGPRVLQPPEVKAIERQVSDLVHEEVNLHAWCRVELVVTGQRMTSLREFTSKVMKERQHVKMHKERKPKQ